MKLISSKLTKFYKKGLPVLWLGMLIFIISTAFVQGEPVPIEMIGMLLGMGLVGVFVMKKLIWDLADEVYDCGDTLLIKNGGESETIRLDDIININESLTNPRRVTLRLGSARVAGAEISFCPAAGLRFSPLAKSAIVEELIVRTNRARITG